MDTRPEVASEQPPVYGETMEKSSEVIRQHIQPLLDSQEPRLLVVKSYIVEERTFRFVFPISEGVSQLYNAVREKICSALDKASICQLAIGYVDTDGDLVAIISDDDLLEAAIGKLRGQPRLSLVAYELGSHLEVSKTLERESRRAFICGSLVCAVLTFTIFKCSGLF
jgi:hypothetical protein